MFNPSILRAYDIRGIIGETLNVKDAELLGKVFASEIQERYGSCNIALGYDGRLSSPLLEEYLIKGLMYSGANVTRIGIGPSPMLYYSSIILNSDAAIMITGSHNAANYNGFKILDKKGNFYGEDIQKLGKRAQNKNFLKSKGNVKNFSIEESYLRKLIEAIDIKKKNLSIGWDAGNGATGRLLSKLLDFLPGKNILINEKIDGTFPNHHPDPTVPENLKQLIKIVKNKKMDLGIAFDGDGDRLAVVDKDGNIIFGDKLLYIFAKSVLQNNPRSTIIADVKASEYFFSEVEKLGGKALMWKTGHSLIKNKMKETGSLLAGEMSGHIFFADKYYGFDDALYASVRLVNIISQGKGIKELLSSFPKTYSTSEIRLECNDKEKFVVIDKFKKIALKKYKNVSLIDGIRVKSSKGWWLARVSNTQPAIVIRCESSTKELLLEFLKEVTIILKKSGLEVNLNNYKIY